RHYGTALHREIDRAQRRPASVRPGLPAVVHQDQAPRLVVGLAVNRACAAPCRAAATAGSSGSKEQVHRILDCHASATTAAATAEAEAIASAAVGRDGAGAGEGADRQPNAAAGAAAAAVG